MYPEKPWKTISKEAIACIQHFLVVQHDARYTVDSALTDKWVSDKQCLSDIGKLEEEANILLNNLLFNQEINFLQVGKQWLTTELDQAGNFVEKM